MVQQHGGRGAGAQGVHNDRGALSLDGVGASGGAFDNIDAHVPRYLSEYVICIVMIGIRHQPVAMPMMESAMPSMRSKINHQRMGARVYSNTLSSLMV